MHVRMCERVAWARTLVCLFAHYKRFVVDDTQQNMLLWITIFTQIRNAEDKWCRWKKNKVKKIYSEQAERRLVKNVNEISSVVIYILYLEWLTVATSTTPPSTTTNRPAKAVIYLWGVFLSPKIQIKCIVILTTDVKMIVRPFHHFNKNVSRLFWIACMLNGLVMCTSVDTSSDHHIGFIIDCLMLSMFIWVTG